MMKFVTAINLTHVDWQNIEAPQYFFKSIAVKGINYFLHQEGKRTCTVQQIMFWTMCSSDVGLNRWTDLAFFSQPINSRSTQHSALMPLCPKKNCPSWHVYGPCFLPSAQDGYNACFFAASEGYVEIIELLLADGAPLDFPCHVSSWNLHQRHMNHCYGIS